MNWQSREDERVARALEGAPLHGREDRGIVALAERIREVPAATGLDAAPDFRAALRARVLAEGATLLPRPRTPAEVTPDRPHPLGVPTTAGAPSAGGPESRPPRARHSQSPPNRPTARPHRRRKAFAAATLVIATLSVTTVAASGDALPGDPLYGLKLRVQGVEMIVARSDVDRGHRHLELARIRVRELNTAALSASPGPLLSTLDDMDSETRDGIRLLSTAAVADTDEAELGELAAWTVEQRALLTAAAARLPAAARARAARSLALLTTVAARIEELRASLRCDCAPATGPDVLGPQPCGSARCRAATTTAPSTPPPVQTQTRPAPGTVPPPASTVPAPGWPPGRVGTIPPGRAPTGSAGPPPPPGPSWPEPEPPVITTSPTPAAPVPTHSTEPAPTTEPTVPKSAPGAVTGILGGVVGVLRLPR